MNPKAFILGLVTCISLLRVASATDYIYLRDNNGPNVPSAHIMPKTFPQPPPFQVGWGTPSPWFIAQWTNPHPFTAQSSTGSCVGAAWGLATPSARLCWTNPKPFSSYTVELAQNGAALPCGSSWMSNEFDLFLVPDQYGDRTRWLTSPTLTQLTSLRVGYGLAYTWRQVKPKCGGAKDQSNVLIGLVLQTIDNKQVNWYQGLLANSYPTAPDVCTGAPHWYFGTNPFGMNDYVPELCAKADGVRRAMSYDFLPRLRWSVQNSPASMEKDPAKWRLVDFYFGTYVYGDASITTRWDSISIVGITR